MSSVAQRRLAGMDRSVLLAPEFTLSLTVCLATVVGAAWVLLDTPPSTRSIALPVLLPGAALMFGLGLSDLAGAREIRFARALIVAGLLWSVSALTASTTPIFYSVGHVSQWCVILAIAYVLLSFPTGRLAERADRALFAGGALLLGLLYLPTALLTNQFPNPSLWSNCTSGCTHNALSLAHSNPALIRDLVLPLRQVLTVLLFAAIAVAVIRRAQKAGPLLRRFYAPISAFAVFQTAVFAVYFPLRAVAPGSRVLPVVGWIFVLSLPVVGVACGAGRLYRHFYAANALDRIARNLRGGASPVQVRRALADALADPSLRILQSFPGDSGDWVDESGSLVTLAYDSGDGLTEIASATRRIAIVHDPALSADPFLIEIIGSYALAALENDRLSGELKTSREQLAESRRRRLTTEQSARQKIERDLHDGAQQRLVALRVKLELAATVLETKDPANAKTIRALGDDVDTTIDEVRAFARGIYPAMLAQTGLEQALRGASRDAALPAVVRVDRLGRYPPETEATVYFCCSEALQNACKHAAGATGVAISLWQDRRLNFEVRDDGAGFALESTPYGTGLTNLRDRLTAVGGTMTISSIPGHGTVLGGSIPLA